MLINIKSVIDYAQASKEGTLDKLIARAHGVEQTHYLMGEHAGYEDIVRHLTDIADSNEIESEIANEFFGMRLRNTKSAALYRQSHMNAVNLANNWFAFGTMNAYKQILVVLNLTIQQHKTSED